MYNHISYTLMKNKIICKMCGCPFSFKHLNKKHNINFKVYRDKYYKNFEKTVEKKIRKNGKITTLNGVIKWHPFRKELVKSNKQRCKIGQNRKDIFDNVYYASALLYFLKSDKEFYCYEDIKRFIPNQSTWETNLKRILKGRDNDEKAYYMRLKVRTIGSSIENKKRKINNKKFNIKFINKDFREKFIIEAKKVQKVSYFKLDKVKLLQAVSLKFSKFLNEQILESIFKETNELKKSSIPEINKLLESKNLKNITQAIRYISNKGRNNIVRKRLKKLKKELSGIVKIMTYLESDIDLGKKDYFKKISKQINKLNFKEFFAFFDKLIEEVKQLHINILSKNPVDSLFYFKEIFDYVKNFEFKEPYTFTDIFYSMIWFMSLEYECYINDSTYMFDCKINEKYDSNLNMKKDKKDVSLFRIAFIYTNFVNDLVNNPNFPTWIDDYKEQMMV